MTIKQPFNKVIIIAFIYPPLGGSGVQRTLKFTKYLPEFGWQPYVVCSDDPQVFGAGLDHSLAADIPDDVQVWRRPFVDPLGLRRWAQKAMGIKPREGITSQEPLQLSTIDGEGGRGKWLRRLIQKMTTPLAPFEFPAVDAALYWALAIIPGCLRLIRREKIDLIFTSSFPYSDHVAGYLLKKLTEKPWVADFRDPWTQNASARNSGWRFRVDEWVEGGILRTADKVLGVTPTYTHELHCLAPRRASEDFVTIENGYDSADFSRADYSQEIASSKPFAMPAVEFIQEPSRRVTLAHVGHLYDGTALPFFQALERIGKAAARLQVRFIGGLAPQEQAWLERHPLAAQIQVEQRLPHAQAVQAMLEADALLLFVIGGFPKSGHYPGKLFEYMASGTPVLLIGPDGDASKLLQSSGTGCFSPADDPEGLAKILQLLVEQPGSFRRSYFRPNQQMIARYERRALTEMLARELDTLMESVNS